jgi:peptidoglycan/LPS O-acetylase OafA/YrhL
MKSHQDNRLGSLDALRGFAALFVVWAHSVEYFSHFVKPGESPGVLYDIVQAIDPGRIGVVCFFLISGFIIPSSFRGLGQKPLLEFATKRFFRLYPAYWLALFLAIYVDDVTRNLVYDMPRILANLTMVQNILQYEHIQGLSWTLQVELIFYVLCAALYAFGFLGRSRHILFILTASLGLFAVANGLGGKFHLINKFNKELFYTPYLLAVMLCGSLFRIWFDSGSRKELWPVIVGFGLVFSVPVAAFAAETVAHVRIVEDASRFLWSHLIGFALFFVALNLKVTWGRFFVRMGAISYSIYLFHPPVIHVIGYLTTESGPAFMAYFDTIASRMVWVTVFTILLADLVYRTVELPFNKLPRKIFKRSRTMA